MRQSPPAAAMTSRRCSSIAASWIGDLADFNAAAPSALACCDAENLAAGVVACVMECCSTDVSFHAGKSVAGC
jgi:hypothetical protein